MRQYRMPMDEWPSIAVNSKLSTLKTGELKEALIKQVLHQDEKSELVQDQVFMFHSMFDAISEEIPKMLQIHQRPELQVGCVVQRNLLLEPKSKISFNTKDSDVAD